MSNFISNSTNKTLQKRISELISFSKELKFLVGFFYFSGIDALFDTLQNNNDIPMKILVGLQADRINYQVIEYAEKNYKNTSGEKLKEKFLESVKKSINSEEFDSEKFFKQIQFFLNKIKDGTITIRKTIEPNHAKIYLFKLKEGQAKDTIFITGSSNFTRAGLTTQNEFNVEISDYGCKEAEEYFDNLWSDRNSIKITEDEQIKKRLIEIIENETHLKKFTPFEAYVYILKSYIESYEFKDISDRTAILLEKRGYKPYKYQLDAVNLALSIIEKYNGVILSDVVGLGKTIISCLIANRLQKKGIVICPPNLIGDDNKKSGWKKYLEEFDLYDWDVKSSGDLKKAYEFVSERNDIKVVIVDEAHRFRNEDTSTYECLKNICRGKIVLLLSATPFNNKPSDIFALLKLFTIPRQSNLALDDDIEAKFITYKNLFKDLSYITRYYNSNDSEKRKRAKSLYRKRFMSESINISLVKRKVHEIASEIRAVIEPVVIRRNRIDLMNNPEYKDEVKELPKVKDPEQWFYELTEEQSKFYDDILQKFFAEPEEGGKFTGAIYRPFFYEEGIFSPEEIADKIQLNKVNQLEESIDEGEKINRELMQQQNLYNFMRRLLVKRFESSFGAFYKSLINFKNIHEKALNFIIKTGKGDPLNGKYYLIRNLIDTVNELNDENYEEIEEKITEYENEFLEKFENEEVLPKKEKPYIIKKFKYAQQFIEDIKNDIELFDQIIKKMDELKLIDQDPKAIALIEKLKQILKEKPKGNEPKRKIIIFSEYADTVKHLQNKLENENFRVLTVCGQISSSIITKIYENFDASYGKNRYNFENNMSKAQKDDFDILLGTDKISEGFNLNRAGMIINYDIPWNPVRVIQRLGRINRISKKVFDELYIVNFFPTQKGENIIPREIAQSKMFMIHKILGEDVKIFDIDETPSASELYTRLAQNPENLETESFYTKMYRQYLQIKEKYPDIIKSFKDLPKRIKVSRLNSLNNLIVVFKKDRLFSLVYNYNDSSISEKPIETILQQISCDIYEKPAEIDSRFWEAYEKLKDYKIFSNTMTFNQNGQNNEVINRSQSVYGRAKANLDLLIRKKDKIPRLSPYIKFIQDLKEDMIDYGTLSDFTLRRIANLSTDFIISFNKNNVYKEEEKIDDNKVNELISQIEEIKNILGEDFLEEEKSRLNKVEKEIIIAFENKDSFEFK